MFAMLLLVRRLLVLVFLAVAIESAAQGELRMTNDLHGLGRESDLRKIPVVLFFSNVHCEYCDLVRDEFLNHLSTDPTFMNKLLLREVRMDSARPIVRLQQTVNHPTLPSPNSALLSSYQQFNSPMVWVIFWWRTLWDVTTLGIYGAYLEQAIEQSLSALRLRN